MNGINHRLVATGLLAWSLLAVPIVFTLVFNWAYVYSLGKGELPPPWSGIGLLAIFLIGGLVGVARLPVLHDKHLWVKISLSATYLLLMGVTLFALGGIVACNNGDCI